MQALPMPMRQELMHGLQGRPVLVESLQKSELLALVLQGFQGNNTLKAK